MAHSDLNDCFSYGGARLAHADAINLLKCRIRSIVGQCEVPLLDGVGRILSVPIAATRDVPTHTNAAVDGYAFFSADYNQLTGACLRVIGRSAAGSPFEGRVERGCSIRILTGAIVPEGLDMVAMQEACLVSGDAASQSVTIPGGLKCGVNIRQAGEDVRLGEELLASGHVLRPQDIAAISSIGADRLQCFERLRIGIVSTGNEIVEPGAPVRSAGQVFDANRPMLMSLSALGGGRIVDGGIWPDDRSAVTERLGELAGQCDVVLTSGGASGGDEDHMAAALQALGTCHFWTLGIKPGRPLMLGQIGRTVVVGLPGNPVAVFVCFVVYVWPMLRALSGAGWREPARMPARAAFSFRNRKRGRREFWRGMISHDRTGTVVSKFRRDGSGLITGLRESNCLIEIDEQTGDVSEGDIVQVIPFAEIGITSC